MDALDKILKVQPEADMKAEEVEVKKMLDKGDKHKTHTTHYKMTQTKVTEVEQRETSDDEALQEEHVINEKKKHRGCFASCLKKKKG